MMSYFEKVNTYFGGLSLSQAAQDDRVVEYARIAVSLFYYLLPLVVFLYANNEIIERQNFDPLWPLVWASYLGIEYIPLAYLLTFSCIATAFLGIFFHPYQGMRILVFGTLWQWHALLSSFGQPNHQLYLWLYASLIFIPLPDLWRGTRSLESKRDFLLFLWCAQALVMLSYTMAGLQKIYYLITQSFAGEVSGISINGFAYQIAAWLPKLQTPALFGDFIIMHPWVGWFPYVALHVLQASAIMVMLYPRFQKVWAVLLVLFHFGTYWTMGISFTSNAILLIALFFVAPFSLTSPPFSFNETRRTFFRRLGTRQQHTTMRS